jgi:hypothetical protein
LSERRRLTRREAIRKGAIVGGNLLWIAPAIQTLAPAASAHVTSPATFSCCECRAGQTGREKCNGLGGLECIPSFSGNESACQSACAAMGKSYCFHAGPSPIACSGNACAAH